MSLGICPRAEVALEDVAPDVFAPVVDPVPVTVVAIALLNSSGGLGAGLAS